MDFGYTLLSQHKYLFELILLSFKMHFEDVIAESATRHILHLSMCEIVEEMHQTAAKSEEHSMVVVRAHMRRVVCNQVRVAKAMLQTLAIVCYGGRTGANVRWTYVWTVQAAKENHAASAESIQHSRDLFNIHVLMPRLLAAKAIAKVRLGLAHFGNGLCPTLHPTPAVVGFAETPHSIIVTLWDVRRYHIWSQWGEARILLDF